MTVGSRITSLRKAKKMSQEEFSSAINVSRSAYQYYEREEREMPASVLDRICKTFNDDPNRVLNGEPSPQLMAITGEILQTTLEIAQSENQNISPARLSKLVLRVIGKIYEEYDSLDDVKIERDEIKELVELIA